MTALALDRSTFLGGSDAAAALGVSPFKTRAELWLEKTGRVEPSQEETGPQTWGKLLEGPVADHWASVTGLKIRKTSKDYSHPKFEFIRGHLDRTVDGQDRFLEVKTTNTWKRDEWGETGSDLIPLHYRVQLATYFAVTDFPTAEVAVLIGGNDFRMYTIARDDELISKVVDGLALFWDYYVTKDEEPEPLDFGEACSLYPVHTDEVVAARASEVRLWNKWHKLQERAKKLEAELDEVKQKVSMRMDNAGVLRSDAMDQELVTWKLENRAVLDQQALRRDHPHLFRDYLRVSSSRVMRFKKERKAKK